MGSSAALITSIVSALLLKFGVVSKEGFAQLDGRDRVLAHNTAQSVHCLAQGKVGSGFDVSAAAFGSHVYTRFDPKVLAPLMKITGDFANVCHGHFLSFRRREYDVLLQLALIPLQPILDPAVPVHNKPTWTSRVEPFQLPPLVRLVLADVAGGSSTPSLVRKVNEWRSNNPDDGTDFLHLLSICIHRYVFSEETMVRYRRFKQESGGGSPQSYCHVQREYRCIRSDSSNPFPPATRAVDNNRHGGNHKARGPSLRQSFSSKRGKLIMTDLQHILSFAQTTRTLMRKMGENAGVDIEPAAQTDLLDKSITQAGVIGGGVPGGACLYLVRLDLRLISYSGW